MTIASVIDKTTFRYSGYLIRCAGESLTITLAGEEVLYQPYPGLRVRLGQDAFGPWMLDQAKSFVDAHRAGKV